MGKIIEADTLTGVTEIFHKDKTENKVIVEKVQDVEPLLDANKRDMANDTGNYKGDLHKVASIPMIVVMQWGEELKAAGRNPWPFHKSNRQWLIAKLNNREYSALRTKKGRI